MAASGPSVQRRASSISAQSSPAPAPAPSSRNNPISLRIYKAIGTSFDDPDSREALELASKLYSGTGAKGKGRAAEEDEDAQLHDNESIVRRAAKGESAAMARKYLKRDIEARLASGSQKFLEAFGEVDKVCSAL